MFKTIVTVFFLGVGVGMGAAYCCRQRKQSTPLKQEAKAQPKPYDVANGEGTRSKEIPFDGSLQAARITTQTS